MEYRYNYDLLWDKDDRAAAERAFPRIFPALDHPELRERFHRENEIADDMKQKSQKVGTISITLIALALMGASTAHLVDYSPGARLIAGLSALAGLFGALIGGFGVMHSSRKRRWLLHRYAAERLRQFFFQIQTVLAPEIIRAVEKNDWTRFEALRAAEFSEFEQMLNTATEARFELALDDRATDDPPDRWIIRRDPGPAEPESGEAIEEFKNAYRLLRFDAQRSFAQHKLRHTRAWFWSDPADQLRRLKFAANTSILLSVALHIAVAFAVARGAPEHVITWLHIAAIWLAILALAVRTFDEGLRPGAEVERYRAYRDSARHILDRFNRAPDLASTIVAMREMETLSYDEMIAFLKSGKRASFAM